MTQRRAAKVNLTGVLDCVSRLWPIIVGVICCIFFLGGRLEDVSSKKLRIREAIAPLEARLSKAEAHLEAHRTSSGHAVTMSQLHALEAELRRIHKDCESNDEPR